jgi:uncharacterized protein YbjT (DUF2867 family)
MSTRKTKVLITGATGQVGREVVARLVGDPSLDLVGASRAPENAKLDIPVVRLDYNAFATIPSALEGIDRMFILTGSTVDMRRERLIKPNRT